MKYDRTKVEAALLKAQVDSTGSPQKRARAMILAALDAIFLEPPLRYPVTAAMVAAERDANGGTMMEAKERCIKAARGE